MTPLYDVMSAQPAHDTHKIRRSQLKLAMSIGNNRHYTVHGIVPRHSLQTADACGMPEADMQDILDELEATMPNALDATSAEVPEYFPSALFESIHDGVTNRLAKIAIGNDTRD